MTSSPGCFGHLLGTLLALLLLLTGCSARLKNASLGTKDVCLRLPSMGGKPGQFRCGYYAGRQMIQYYRPEITDEDITTDSLLFVKANDTVSVLHYLKDNLAIPLIMKNGSVDGLLESIASGDPVTVFLPGDAFAFRGLNLIGTTFLLHCIVVVGHGERGAELFFYSDGEGPYVISREAFAKQWARVENLCIMRAR